MSDEDEARLKKQRRQVRKLIALAASSNENEAKQAAMKACAIIREQKLILLTPDAFETLKSALHAPRGMGEPYCVTVREGGTSCSDCGGEFRRGERVWFRAGVGAVHAMKCDPSLLL